MNNISHRISSLIEEKKLNFTTFGKLIGKSDVTIRKNAKGYSKPNFELMSLILEKLPEVSAEWLMRGDGYMYRKGYNQSTGKFNLVTEPDTKYETEIQRDLIDCQKKIIELQDQLQFSQRKLFEMKLASKNIIRTDK